MEHHKVNLRLTVSFQILNFTNAHSNIIYYICIN